MMDKISGFLFIAVIVLLVVGATISILRQYHVI